MEKKKISIMMLGIIGMILTLSGVTYAFWTINLKQTDEEKIASSCFKVTLEKEGTAIHLEKAYPILDSDGEKLTPYTFTIKNVCNENAGYQINLESLSQIDKTMIQESDRLNAKYVKLKINETDKEGSISILGENDSITKTLKDAYESHKLMTGYLGPQASKTFELRLWLDGAITMENKEVMNKKFASKITVTASYLKEELIPPTVNLELAVCENNIIARGTGKANGGKQINKYEFQLDDKEWTPNDMESIKRFTDLDPGNHTIKFRVTDDKGVMNETLRTVEVNYKEPTVATLGEKTISLVTEGNGLYKVSHCDVTGTMDDLGFSQEEYRYAGASPNNYVKFNDELWRIIGLVNVQTKEGVTQRLKIIKSTLIAKDNWNESWENDWTQATLMKKLNEIDGIEGEYYTKIVTNISKNMIAGDIIWNIGGWSTLSVTAPEMYSYERGTNVFSGRSTIWPKKDDNTTIAKVGLMYLSDYGYALGGTKENRNICLSKELVNWRDTEECNNVEDWLKPSREYSWTISPSTTYGDGVFNMAANGEINSAGVNKWSLNVLPVVYLKSNVKIINDGQDGSESKPYNLQQIS